jgi:DNA-binding GntR family transcriptional regulator
VCSSDLNTSRTPIREALQLLEAEELVVAAKRGYVVREHTRDEIVEIYEVRSALEGMAARLAAGKLGSSAYKEIEKVGAHKDALITSNDRDLIVDLNDQFHAAIFIACGNSRLERINRSNSQHFFNHRIAQMYTKEETKLSIKGHAAILKAIKNHDPDDAESQAQRHVMDALEVTLTKLR